MVRTSELKESMVITVTMLDRKSATDFAMVEKKITVTAFAVAYVTEAPAGRPKARIYFDKDFFLDVLETVDEVTSQIKTCFGRKPGKQ